jgi:hypothetical protein
MCREVEHAAGVEVNQDAAIVPIYEIIHDLPAAIFGVLPRTRQLVRDAKAVV